MPVIGESKPGDGQQPLRRVLTPYARDSCVIAFLKAYSASRKKFLFAGSCIFELNKPLSAYFEVINAQLSLSRDAKLNFYLEVSPDYVFQVTDTEKPISSDRNMIVDGLILIVEEAAVATDENNINRAYNEMFAHM